MIASSNGSGSNSNRNPPSAGDRRGLGGMLIYLASPHATGATAPIPLRPGSSLPALYSESLQTDHGLASLVLENHMWIALYLALPLSRLCAAVGRAERRQLRFRRKLDDHLIVSALAVFARLGTQDPTDLDCRCCRRGNPCRQRPVPDPLGGYVSGARGRALKPCRLLVPFPKRTGDGVPGRCHPSACEVPAVDVLDGAPLPPPPVIWNSPAPGGLEGPRRQAGVRAEASSFALTPAPSVAAPLLIPLELLPACAGTRLAQVSA